MLPNMVVFKIDSELYDCALTFDGSLVGDPQCFTSDYDVPEDALLFVCYDQGRQSSRHHSQWFVKHDQLNTVKEIIEHDVEEFEALVKYLFITECPLIGEHGVNQNSTQSGS